MKLLLPLLFAFSFSTFAAPRPEAEGVYNANTTVSHAPPRTTHALIEPNGEIWITSAFYGNSFQDGPPIIGKINTKKGDGDALIFTNRSDLPPIIPLSVSTIITGSTVKFTFTEINEPFHPELYLHAPGFGKPSAYDAPLNLQPKVPLLVPSSVFTDGAFSISVIGENFTGTDGNCTFNGKLKEKKYYDTVSLTYRSDCYAPDGITRILKGSKAEGVLFGSKRYPGGTPVEILVLIVQGKNFGFARFFDL